jgi:hypothetical protein
LLITTWRDFVGKQPEFPNQTGWLGGVAGEEVGECVLAVSVDVGGGESLLCPAHHHLFNMAIAPLTDIGSMAAQHPL